MVSHLQSVCVEQLTLDFEYLINEVIRSDAAWAPQFCSFSDYDVVILEVSTHTYSSFSFHHITTSQKYPNMLKLYYILFKIY